MFSKYYFVDVFLAQFDLMISKTQIQLGEENL
jgi:hypothetical protein